MLAHVVNGQLETIRDVYNARTLIQCKPVPPLVAGDAAPLAGFSLIALQNEASHATSLSRRMRIRVTVQLVHVECM